MIWNKHILNCSKKSDSISRVVWSMRGLVVEYTILHDGSTHSHISPILSRDISVLLHFPQAPGFGEAEANLIHVNICMENCMSIQLQYSL